MHSRRILVHIFFPIPPTASDSRHIVKQGCTPCAPICHASSSEGSNEPEYKTRLDKMYETKNDIPEKTRTAAITLLNARLADAVDLMHQAKQAHGNVKEPGFIACHKLFDEIVDAAEEYMDLIAERTVQLGGTAEGTVQVAAKRSALKEYPAEISGERDHVEALVIVDENDVLRDEGEAYARTLIQEIGRAHV